MGPHLILLGPPASGKGTQGRRLAGALGLPYLSTGALLREAVENGTPAGREAEPVLERGGYVSDRLMNSIIEPWLETHRNGWVLDGFPRTIAQDDFLRHWLAGHQQSIDGDHRPGGAEGGADGADPKSGRMSGLSLVGPAVRSGGSGTVSEVRQRSRAAKGRLRGELSLTIR